ncbi:hypothetical protein BDZ45DRAFT_751409 [Acephala macrosclerotiorum]|nr:hypothetical protein BDZ45DRAFT_751409 [Acephala macrosclerotiorum]
MSSNQNPFDKSSNLPMSWILFKAFLNNSYLYLAESLLKGNIAFIKVPGPVIPLRSTRSSADTASSNNTFPARPSPADGGSPECKKHAIPALESPQVSSFRRYQTLHVLHFAKSPRRASWLSKLDKLLSSAFTTAVTFMFKVSLAVILTRFGMYGIAAIHLRNSTTQLVARAVKIGRPSSFPDNNEDHDACMLVGTHQNSPLWYLFVGDRGTADSLLNKPMVVIPQQLGAAVCLRTVHIIQLLAMKFVASQK